VQYLFAWRYFKSKKSTSAINIIAWVSVTAIAVGAAALIVILSVFNGFEDLVKGLYTDFYADMRIVPAQGKKMDLDSSTLYKIQSIQGVKEVSKVIEEKALLANGDYQSIVVVKGVDSVFSRTNNINKHIVRGSYDMGDLQNPSIVMGAGIENAVGVDVTKGGFPLTLYTPNKGAAFDAADGMFSFNVVAKGVFAVQQEFDNKYIFTNIDFLRYMLSMTPNQVSGLEIKINGSPKKIKAAIQNAIGKNFMVETRYEQNKNLYAVMQMEKWIIYGILSLILIVAAFNMIGALTMLVLEKQKDIAVLRAMGSSAVLIQKIFITEGLVLAGVGTFIGTALGTLICVLQLKFKIITLGGGGSFIIDYYPVKLMATDYVLVVATTTVIALMAAWIPAKKASQQLLSLKS
jgi:lipoprotein-releasing system permease protein